ncbi:MAG: hypothetical protein LUC92_05565 [Clostridiales bacterium]|nr:hypothetical protein [Clostridiales bacterium]
MLQLLYKLKKLLILSSNSDILITSQATKAVNENTSGDTAESLHAENSADSFFINIIYIVKSCSATVRALSDARFKAYCQTEKL